MTGTEVVRAASSSGHDRSSEGSSSGSSTVPLQHSHRSHRKCAAESRLLQVQTYLDPTDRRSFAMLPMSRVHHVRVSVLVQQERSQCCVENSRLISSLALLRFGGTSCMDFIAT